MLKHLLCPLFAIVTVILIAVFPWRLKFVEIPIRDSLEYISGKPVIISKVIYHPIAQFTIEGLNIDGSMTAERTTVYVNLLNLIKYRDITKSIRKIIIYKPDIDLGQLSKYNLPTYDAKGLKHTTDNKPNELILIWNDGKLSFNGYTVTAFSGRAKLGSIDNAEMKGECLGGKIICNSNYKKIGDSNILNTAVSYMAPNSDIIINLCGKINKNNNIEVYCDIPKIRISSYSLENSSAVFKYNRENMSGTLYTRAGKAGLSGRDFNVFSSSGDFDFSKISGIKSGRLGIIAYKDIGGFNGNIKLNNFHTGEINIKSAFLNVKNNLSGEWDLRGNVDPNKYTIEGAIKNNKYLKLDINLREDGVCSVEGKLHPLHLNISGNRLNIENIPFFSHNYPGIKGLISIKGVMRNNEQKYIFKIIDIKYAINVTPEVPVELMNNADNISKELETISLKFTRSSDRPSSEENPPSPVTFNERLGVLAYTHGRSTASITQNERNAYSALVSEFPSVLDRLKAINNIDIKNLESELEKYNAPWTPGRIPDVKLK